jgi:hypothetical protein
MQKGLTLGQLAAKIEANKGLKKDYIADTRNMAMVMGGETQKRPMLELPNIGQFPILSLAHDQIGARTNIPSKYYDRMLAEAPELLANNVNHWFRQNPEKRMVRTLGGDDRAFLSNRFQRIEHENIAEAALPVLADLPKVEIVSAEITDRRLYIHFVVPTIQGEVKVGDIVQAGGIISNSEVGLGSVSVAGMIWRLWCLNGAKTADTFRRNHVGRQVEDEGEIDWGDDTRRADDQTVLLKVRDMVKAVVDQTRFRATLGKLQGLSAAKITGDPTKTVELLAARVGASETEKSGILRSLIEGSDLSAWGAINAVTSLAHKAKDYDRAVELEAAGGALIDLDPSQWREVLQAA